MFAMLLTAIYESYNLVLKFELVNATNSSVKKLKKATIYKIKSL